LRSWTPCKHQAFRLFAPQENRIEVQQGLRTGEEEVLVRKVQDLTTEVLERGGPIGSCWGRMTRGPTSTYPPTGEWGARGGITEGNRRREICSQRL